MKGLTFIEVLVSIFLLSIIVGGFFLGLSSILSQDAYIKSEARVLELAEQKLEEVRRIKLANWNATFTLTGNFSNIGWTGIVYTIYTSNYFTASMMIYTVTVIDYIFGGRCDLCTIVTKR